MVLAIEMAFNLTLASTVGLALPIDSVVESHIKFGIGSVTETPNTGIDRDFCD